MPTISGIIVSTGTESEGRRTLLEVVDELARPIDAADETIRALAGDAFRAAVRIMNRKGLWPWEILEEDVNITANEKFSTISGPVKKPLSMYYLDAAAGNPTCPIWYVSYDRYAENYAQDITRQPDHYTIPNLFETGQVRWCYIPSNNDFARFIYYRVTPAPQAETETIEVPDWVIEAYMAYARLELVKRCPSYRAILSLGEALAEARIAFRELSAHVASPGDRSRWVAY